MDEFSAVMRYSSRYGVPARMQIYSRAPLMSISGASATNLDRRDAVFSLYAMSGTVWIRRYLNKLLVGNGPVPRFYHEHDLYYISRLKTNWLHPIPPPHFKRRSANP